MSEQNKFDTIRLLDGVQPSDTYRLEDIMKEYGAKPEQLQDKPARAPVEEPVREPEPAALPEDDIWAEIEQERRGGKPKKRPHRQEQTQSAAPSPPKILQPVFGEEPEPAQQTKPRRAGAPVEKAKRAEPAPQDTQDAPVLRDSARERRRKLREAEVAMPKPELSPERMARYYRRTSGSARRRLLPVAVLCLIAAYLTLAEHFAWAAPSLTVLSRTLAVLTLLTMGLCFDVVAQTVYELLHLRCRASTLVLATSVFTVVDAFLAQHAPYCLIAMLGWLFCLWGQYDTHSAMRRSARLVEKGGVQYTVRSQEDLWDRMDGITLTEGTAEGFLTQISTPDYLTQLMQYYVPIAVGASLVLSLLVTLLRDANFFYAMAAMLSAATPLMAAMCFAHPFALLSKRLFRCQAAIAGWAGAELVSGHQAVILRDGDLFPEASVSLNGAKFFDTFERSYVISCAATVLDASGGDLAPLFRSMAHEFGVDIASMSSYKAYESGGYGATIRGDVVLVGTVGFMRMMGIAIPDGTMVRQAVYVAINAQLAGIFAINYAPDRAVRAALEALCSQKRLVNVFATRDFILNPALLRQRFHLSGGRLEFPPVEERIALSEPNCGAQGQRAAILNSNHFTDYSDVVVGGRQMHFTVTLSSLLCIVSGTVAMAILFLLFYLKELIAAVPVNLLLYSVLWAIPALLITSLTDKY